jgi:hypothetical protein
MSCGSGEGTMELERAVKEGECVEGEGCDVGMMRQVSGGWMLTDADRGGLHG